MLHQNEGEVFFLTRVQDDCIVRVRDGDKNDTTETMEERNLTVLRPDF